MKQIFFTLMLLLTVGLSAEAQRTFQYRDITEADEPFGESETAGLIISCNRNRPLSFESNLDTEVRVYQQEEDGDNTVYYLILDAGERYRGRQLSIKSSGYYTLTFEPRLRNGFIYRYEIYDPNDAFEGSCFQAHRSKGLQYFDDCNYMAAREEFGLAADCAEADESQREEARQHLADCDSLIEWRRKGNEAFCLLDYEAAMEYFSRAQSLNSQDRYVVERYSECSVAQSERSIKYFNAAEAYFREKEYEDAITMYRKVEALRENNVGAALTRRIVAERMLSRRRQATTCISLELCNKDMYGLSVGSYRNRTGGYFTLKANKSVIDLARGDWRLDDLPEVDMSFGWTLPVVKKMNEIFQGLYLQFGPGIAVLSRYSAKSNKFQDIETVTQEDVDAQISQGTKAKDLLDLKVSAAITPELGATVKLWHLALRATYQYRLAIDKAYDNYFGKTQWSFGVGYCF